MKKTKKTKTAGTLSTIQTALGAAKTAGKLLKNPWVQGAVLGGIVCITDQLFKDSIERQPDKIFPHDVLEKNPDSRLEFRKLHNNGSMMGSFSDSPDMVRALTTTGMSAAAAGLAKRKQSDRLGIISDLIVLGGAASNAIDRKKRGYVVDYLRLKNGPLSGIVFNLGDVAIAAGSIIGSLDRLIVEAAGQNAKSGKKTGKTSVNKAGNKKKTEKD